MLSDRHRKHVSFDKMPSLYVVKSKYCDVTMQNARGGGDTVFFGVGHSTQDKGADRIHMGVSRQVWCPPKGNLALT